MFTQVKRQPTIEFKLFPETTPEQPVNPSSATDNISHNDSWTTEVVYPYTPIRFTVEGYPYSPVQYSAEHWINLLSIGQAGNGTSQNEVEAPAKPQLDLNAEQWLNLLSGSGPATAENNNETTDVVYPYTPIRFTAEGYPYSPIQYTAQRWINLLSIGQAGSGAK